MGFIELTICETYLRCVMYRTVLIATPFIVTMCTTFIIIKLVTFLHEEGFCLRNYFCR